jgi:hypothetical protein
MSESAEPRLPVPPQTSDTGSADMIATSRRTHTPLVPRQPAPPPPTWSIIVRVRVRVRDHRLHCSVCENVIGFYDPIVVLDPAGPRDTSLHDEPMLVTASAVVHDRCVNGADSGSLQH